MLYHQAAAAYTWGDLFPLPAGRKSPPPEGYTGEHGRQVSDQDRAAWAMHTGNVGLRVPDGVVGLDVDQYGDKRGGDTLAAMEAQLGPLPLGFMSTGRDPRTGSGIRFFRYPGGKLAGALGEAVEVIQHGHRYAVAWPSVVEDRAYQWWQWLPPMGVWQKVGVPRLEDLPELPAPWVEYLASRAAASVGPAAPATDRDQLLAELVLSTQPACGALDALAGAGVAKLEDAGEGGRHDAMTGAVLALVLAAAEGHTGFVDALDTLEAAWDAAIADQERRGEFARMVSTAAAKAAAKYPASIRANLVHLCRVGNPGIPGTVPQDVQAGPGAPGAPVPALAQEPEVFDPLGAWTERDVARAILLHKAPVLRFARDAQGWLTRRGHRWELDPASLTDGAKSIVESVSHKAPRGSSTAGAGTPDHERAQRYKRMTNAAGVGALATMLKAAAPNEAWLAVNLSELDNDPEVLWAGGLAWDLRASRGGLVVADLDPNTPHLAAAATGPDLRPTPMWDRFMEAAFPNPEQRAWVLRLFGVSVTGHADAVLPILYGPPGTGKTTAIRLVAQALGSYAVAAQAAILDGSGGGSSSVEEFALLGKRMAWVDEGPRSSRWANERLKALTGGGSMRARPLYKAEVEWVPTHTLFLSSNDYPQVADPGLRRRVRAVQVDGDAGAVKAAVRAIMGARKLWAQELPGILGRLVLEAAEYLADPTAADNPLAVEADMESLAREQDPLLSWLDDRTAPGGPTKAMELWDDFRAYADRIGTPKNLLPGLTGWGRRLSQLGFPAAHGRDGKTRPLELKRGGFHGPVTGLAPSGLVTLPAPTGHRPSSPETGGSEVESTAGDQLRDQFVTGSPANWSQAEALVPAGFSTIGDQCDQLPPYKSTKGEVIVTPRVRAREGEILESSDLGPQLVTTGHAVTITAPSEAAPEAVPAPPPAVPAKAPRAKAAPKPRAPRPTGVAALEGPFLELPALVVRGHDVPAPTTLTDAAALLGTLADATVWLDVEHSGFPVGHVHYQLRTIQLGTAGWALVLDAQDLEHRGLAVQVLDRAAEIVAHSATADVSLVALAAGVPSDPWWDKTTDTAILAALADPALTGAHARKGALQLKVLAEHLVPDPVAPAADKARAAVFRKGKWLTDNEATTPLERSGWANVPIGHPDMVTYGASDVLDTGRLSEVLPKPAPALLERERNAQRILARLPERGLLLDAERVELHLAEHEAHRDQAAAKLADMGLTEPGSNDQVGRALLALGAALPATKTGKPSTAAEVVDKLAATEGPAQPLARALLEYREHEKLIGTYLLPAAVQCRHGDGRSRPTILTLGAVATGRMSSVRPNIQNVPRPTKAEAKPGGGGGMRGMYLADPGWRFIAADFSSVEVRIAAAVTGDDTLAHMVREGIDLHGEIVKLAWGMDPTDPVFGEVRYQAKRTVFGYLYGAGIPRLSAQLGEHGDKAQSVVDALKALTPTLIGWDKGLREAVRAGTVKTWTHPSGRVAYFNRDLPHKALNLVVQGYGRELLVDAMERWEAIHPGMTVLPIHDELVIHVPEDKAEAWGADLAACMTTAVGQGASRVPIVAELDPPTRRWGTLEP